MTKATTKAVQTRIKRLSEVFEARHGRQPKVSELNELYSQEMRAQADKSSRNPTGRGGFHTQPPEKALENRKKGGYARKGTKNKVKEQDGKGQN